MKFYNFDSAFESIVKEALKHDANQYSFIAFTDNPPNSPQPPAEDATPNTTGTNPAVPPATLPVLKSGDPIKVWYAMEWVKTTVKDVNEALGEFSTSGAEFFFGRFKEENKNWLRVTGLIKTQDYQLIVSDGENNYDSYLTFKAIDDKQAAEKVKMFTPDKWTKLKLINRKTVLQIPII